MFQTGQVTLTYNKGGDDVTGDLPAKATAKYGEKVGLAGPGNLAKPNATFAGWKLDEDETIYQPGDQVTLEKSRTATAQWTSAKHTVTFNTMGGSDVPSQEVVHGEKLATVTPPTQKDKVFMGWKEQGKENKEAYFDLTSAINEDKTLIAIWQDPVQKINDGDTVEEQFIKVTFNEGAHGKLKLDDAEQTSPVIYKVAKDLSFEDAQAKGMAVPSINPAKYYKAVDVNEGWDQPLALNGQDITFIAQYVPEADVIPIDPRVTPDDKLQEEKPEGMVLVEFVVDENEAYMEGITKYYVAVNKEVNVPSPLVFNKIGNNHFKGWIFNNQVTMKINGSFDKDTKISDKLLEKPKIYVKMPVSGIDLIKIESITPGARGKLEVISGGTTRIYEDGQITTKVRQGRKIVEQKVHGFKLEKALKSGDMINFWATNENGDSEVYKYIVL